MFGQDLAVDRDAQALASAWSIFGGFLLS